MINSQYNERLDSSIKEALKNMSVPYSSESWEDMQRLLETDHRKYGRPMGDYSQYLIVGSIGVLLIGSLLFFILRKDTTEQEPTTVESETMPVTDTAQLIPPPVVQDTVKQVAPAVTETPADSSVKNNTEVATLNEDEKEKEEKEEKKEKKKEKKKSAKDSTNISTSETNVPETDSISKKKSSSTPKKKKKKSKSTTKDSVLKPADPDQGVNFLESIDKPLPAEEPVKSSKDSTK